MDVSTDLEQVYSSGAALVRCRAHSLDAFSDGLFDITTRYLTLWRRAEYTPFGGTENACRGRMWKS